MKTAGWSLVLVVLLGRGPAVAGSEPPGRVVIDSADYGDTEYLWRMEEVERGEKTSTLKFTSRKRGSAVGEVMFMLRGLYEVAKSRGTEYFTLLKSWTDEDGAQYACGGFTAHSPASIPEEFGAEFSEIAEEDRQRPSLRVSKMRTLFDRPSLTEEEKAAEEHRRRLSNGEVAAATNDAERFEALQNALFLQRRRKTPDELRAWAEELERLAPRFPGTINYGNAVQDFNQVLGRAALAAGDVDEAKRRLLASAEHNGSPTLRSFGPNMTLARELLLKGEKEVVQQYLARCRRFWKMGAARLDQWSEAVKAGRIPDFGANLDLI